MFDQLVESRTGKKDHRSGRFTMVTGLLYALALAIGLIWSITHFKIDLAETADAATLLAPPPPPPPPPPPAEVVVVQKTPEVATAFVPPKVPPKEIPKAVDVRPKPIRVAPVVAGAVAGGTGSPSGVPGGVAASTGDDAPPPPPPPPKPAATPTPPPPPKPSTQRVSGGVLQGNAIRKTQPPYPPIAKAARAQGAVQVAVTISEEGRVVSAEAVSGHPLLREAAVAAARQWTFKPTELSGQPVKVQGILTFNFTLQ